MPSHEAQIHLLERHSNRKEETDLLFADSLHKVAKRLDLGQLEARSSILVSPVGARDSHT